MELIKPPKTLFFIADMMPTQEDLAAAKKIGLGVTFRNASFVTEDLRDAQIEKCDFVAGAVPASYASKYPLWAGEGAPVATPAPTIVPPVEEVFPPEGWTAHPDSAGYFYKGTEVITEQELRDRFAAPATS